MAETWVDFKTVKAAVSMQAVLDRYNINWLRKSKDELRGRCPIHKGEGSDTFHVSLTKNAFHCFSCKKRGNVLDLVAAMENCGVRDAAVKLAEWFSVTSLSGQAASGGEQKAETSLPSTLPTNKPPDAINKPLTFQLKGVDPAHPYLASRGISKETAETLGVGYFPGKGSMAGRIVIPIHDELGQLVAYAGRSIDGSEPKYKLPGGFHKSLVLYNLDHALQEDSKGAVVMVEGFFDCMKVRQSGHVCVGLMGCSLSKEQEELLCQHFRQVVLLFDGDAAGRNAAEEICRRLVRRLLVRIVDVPEGKQPDQLTPEEINQLLK